MVVAAALIINIFLFRYIPSLSWCVEILTVNGEKLLRELSLKSKAEESAAGIILTAAISLFIVITAFFIIFGAHIVNKYFEYAVKILLCSCALGAGKCRSFTTKIHNLLNSGDISSARQILLENGIYAGESKESIIRETVVKLAKDINDSVAAPVFYMIIGSAPLAFLYVCIDTIDKKIGFANIYYSHFGRFAAKVSDFLDYIPARLSVMMAGISAKILKLNYDNAVNIFWRDRNKLSGSKNGQIVSVVSGALGISLGIGNRKIGDDKKVPDTGDIIKTLKLIYGAVIISSAAALIFSFIF